MAGRKRAEVGLLVGLRWKRGKPPELGKAGLALRTRAHHHRQ